jgi:hypothetical protein
MHHNMLVSPLGLFQFNIVCVSSGTLPVKLCLDFSFAFSAPDLHEETCFQQKIRRALLGSSNQRKVRASLSLFLTSGKIPGLLSIGNRPLREFRHVPSAYQSRAQMSNHGRAYT